MLSETPGENPSAGPTKQNQNPCFTKILGINLKFNVHMTKNWSQIAIWTSDTDYQPVEMFGETY